MSLKDDFPWLEGAATIFEPMATMGTAIAAEIPAGLYGLYETARTGDPRAGAEAVQDLQERYTYMPRTESGMGGLQALGSGIEAVMDWPGLIPSMSANEALAQFQTQAGRLGAGPASIIEGLLAAGPPIPARAGRLAQGIDAWHGSPHRFDRFSKGKINTGEGAQAFGHGLYFTDSEDVARRYMDAEDMMLLSSPNEEISRSTLYALDEYIDDPDFEITPEFLNRVADRIQRDIDKYGVEGVSAGPEVVSELRKSTPEDFVIGQGHLYKSRLGVDPDTLLDWDKPISEQSEAIQDAARQLHASRRLDDMGDEEFRSTMQNIDQNGIWSTEDQMAEFGEVMSKQEMLDSMREYDPEGLVELEEYLSGDFDPSVSGESWYLQNTARRGGGHRLSNEGQARLSEELRAAGIPGLKYSRGENINDYVIFDDELISILERDGQGMLQP